MEKIVVTGGSGLVGQELIPRLRAAGHTAIAIRRPYEPGQMVGATTIINLAGENLSSGRWTPARKQRILESRVNTLKSLQQLAGSAGGSVRTLISASAAGYYGTLTSDAVFSEEDPAGNDFLASVCRAWESAADDFSTMGIRVVTIRIGVVLSEKGGALPKLMMPLKMGLSVPLGRGNQWLPWIHIADLTRAILHFVENQELSGPFNIAAPNPVTNRQFMKFLANEKRRLFIPIGVPSLFLRVLLGEMATVTLEGSRISSDRLSGSGFRFQVPKLQPGVLSGDAPDQL